MDVSSKLTVFFEDPFWIGVYERKELSRLAVSRIVFGQEPKDYEVYGFLLEHWKQLRFSPPVEDCGQKDIKINPKRMQRNISRQLSQTGIGTKAQQAIKLQHEQSVMQRKAYNRQKSEEEKILKYELKQRKKKEKHRGR